MPQRFYSRNAQDVTVELPSQIIVLQHDIQGLVPRNVIQHNRERSFNIWIQNYIQATDFVNQPEEILQVHILQVH